LKRFFEVKGEHSYFMEEYLTGVIESFDGLADRHGEVAFCTSHVFSNDIHKIVINNENLSYYSVREIPAISRTRGVGSLPRSIFVRNFFTSSSSGCPTVACVASRSTSGPRAA